MHKLKLILLYILAFMFVYAFPIARPFNSAMLSSILILIIFSFDKNSFKNLFRVINNKFFLYLLFTYIFFIILVVIVTILKGAYDFTMIKPLINNILSIFISAFIASILYTNYKKLEMSQVIVVLLILQTIFILCMLFFQDFRILMQNFLLTDEELKRLFSYGGVRGLALSGSIAFGIAITMGAMGFILHYWFVTKAKKIFFIYKIFIFLCTLLAALSAGRSAILGFVIGFGFYFFNYSTIFIIKKYFKYFFIITFLLLSIGTYINNSPHLLEVFEKYSMYAFRPIINYIETGNFTVSSVSKLQHMYFYPPSNNIFFGDGFYTEENGNYYMHTDAGYMRFLLFFGLFGSIGLYAIFFMYFIMLYFKFNNSNFRYLLFGFLIMFLVYHYKGDVIFFSVPFMKIFTLMIFYELLKYGNYINKKRNEDCQ